ncbi:MAG: hypoxanthine phosphoribosyltransferase [Synergistaceae bacterium]|nr:hypoxanthine phosphoribosyltransferase [Synergistaceae bacterium]
MEPHYTVGRTLFSGEAIGERVKSLAERIASETPAKELLVVGILNGAVFFLSDLVRQMPSELDVKIDFMSISSYGASTKSSGVVRILKDLGSGVEDRHVLIVEDIVDTGLTLSYLLDVMRTRRPAGLRTCVLLDKKEKRRIAVDIDYCGFAVPDEFVVGYGLDCGGKWRHLPDIHVVNF